MMVPQMRPIVAGRRVRPSQLICTRALLESYNDSSSNWRKARSHASVEIELFEGETLYIPSMWYHRVRGGVTHDFDIAVNAWYDMDFGDRYVYNTFLRRLSGVPDEDDDED